MMSFYQRWAQHVKARDQDETESPTLHMDELGNFNGVGDFEPKFWVEGLRFMPVSMDS